MKKRTYVKATVMFPVNVEGFFDITNDTTTTELSNLILNQARELLPTAPNQRAFISESSTHAHLQN